MAKKRTSSQNGKRSRTKGHQFEREIANDFKAAGFLHAKRQLEYQIDECKGIDIANVDPYKPQCKKYRGYVSVATIGEVICQEELGDVPVLITAGDGLPAMAVLPWRDLLALIAFKHKRKTSGGMK